MQGFDVAAHVIATCAWEAALLPGLHVVDAWEGRDDVRADVEEGDVEYIPLAFGELGMGYGGGGGWLEYPLSCPLCKCACKVRLRICCCATVKC